MMIGNLIVHPRNVISAVVPQFMGGEPRPSEVKPNFAELIQVSKREATAGSKFDAAKQSQDSTVPKSAGSSEQAVFTDERDQSIHRHGKLIEVIPRDVSERLLREANGGENGKGFVEWATNGAANGWNEVETAIGSAGNLSALQLLELQVRVYRVAHKIEIFSKVADQTSSGIKSVLNTNI